MGTLWMPMLTRMTCPSWQSPLNSTGAEPVLMFVYRYSTTLYDAIELFFMSYAIFMNVHLINFDYVNL